jgi:hypothetical protein
LAEFINPADETIQDEDGDIFKTIVEQYSIVEVDDEESETEGEEETALKVLNSKALEALETLRLWNLQQPDAVNKTKAVERSIILSLDRFERKINRVKKETIKQASITSFFSYI